MERLFKFVMDINSPEFSVLFVYFGHEEKIQIKIFPKGYWHSPDQIELLELCTGEVNEGQENVEFIQGHSIEERMENCITWINQVYECEFGHQFNETQMNSVPQDDIAVNKVAQKSLQAIRKHLNMGN